MSPQKWVLTTLAVVVGTSGLAISLNLALDIYGIFRDTHRRHLVVYGDARVAKYLLSTKYVPENFNAVLVGTSVSANWEVSRLGPLHVYNESLNGGNIVEEKAIVDRALQRPGIAIAFMVVQPYLTRSHDFSTVRISPDLVYSAVGSENLWNAYEDILRIRLLGHHREFDAAGTENFQIFRHDLNPDLTDMLRPGTDFSVDPTALAAYREVVAELRAHHAQLVFIVPPIYQDLLDRKRGAFEKYSQLILSETGGMDPWIDFNSARYAALRQNRENFGDGVHLVPGAANRVVGALRTEIQSLLVQGRLRIPELTTIR